jgi:hypothetical protein
MPFLVKVIYSNRTLTVEVDAQGYGFDFEKCFSYHPIYLNKGFYFGASAMTGEFPDSHELVSLDVYELNAKYEPQPEVFAKKVDQKTAKDHVEFQSRFHDMLHKRDAENMKASGTDMVIFIDFFICLSILEISGENGPQY